MTRPIAVPLGLVALVAVVAALAPPLRAAGCRPGEALSMGAVLVACGVAGLAWPAIAWWRTGVALGLHRHHGDLALGRSR